MGNTHTNCLICSGLHNSNCKRFNISNQCLIYLIDIRKGKILKVSYNHKTNKCLQQVCCHSISTRIWINVGLVELQASAAVLTYHTGAEFRFLTFRSVEQVMEIHLTAQCFRAILKVWTKLFRLCYSLRLFFPDIFFLLSQVSNLYFGLKSSLLPLTLPLAFTGGSPSNLLDIQYLLFIYLTMNTNCQEQEVSECLHRHKMCLQQERALSKY